MQWWSLGSGLETDDKIGDVPVNILKEALEKIVRARVEHGKRALRLSEILDMFVVAFSSLDTDL